MSTNVRNQVMGGMFWSLLERFGSQGISFVVGVVLARLLTPSQYGVIALTSVFMAITGVLVNAGFGTALIQKKEVDDLDFDSVFWSSSAIGVVLYAALFFIAPYGAEFYHTPELTTILRVVSLSLLWSGYNSVLNSYLYKKMQFRSFFYRTLSANIFSGVVGISMAYAGFGVWAIVAQNFTSAIVGIAILQICVSWHPRFQYSWERAKSLLKFGGSIMGASLIGAGFNELKGLLIGCLYTPADLALFNKGGSMPKLISGNLSDSLSNVLFPAMSQYADDRERIKQLTRRSMRVASYLVFCFLMILVIICKPLVILLYTEKWAACVPYMQLVCLQLMIEMVSNANLQAMKAAGEGGVIIKLEIYKKPVFFLMTVIGAYISVLALAATLPLYALYGTFVNMRPNKKVLNYSIPEQLRDLAPATLLAAIMFVLVYPLQFVISNYIVLISIEVVLCLAIYLGLSYLFKVESSSYVKGVVIDMISEIRNH